MLPHGVPDEDHDNGSESGSLKVHYGFDCDLSIVTSDSSDVDTPQDSGRVPFDVCTQQFGSHMVHGMEQGEALAMFTDLEILSGHSLTYVADGHQTLGLSSHDMHGLQHHNLCETIADVDVLFADAHHRRPHGAEAVPCVQQKALLMEAVRMYAGKSPYDVEKQVQPTGLQSNVNRRRNSVWFAAGQTVCLMMLVTALAWHYLFVRS